MKIPKLSIVICTFNKPELIKRCIKSVLEQSFKDYEILLLDGGSDKKTLELLKKFERENKKIKIIPNPAGLPEGYGKGKWLAFKKSKSEIFGILDQDNMLIGKDCLKNLITPFQNPEISGVAGRLFLDSEDNLTNQCVALIGTDPFVAYRSLDYLINTEKIKFKNFKEYIMFENNFDNLTITGGNCFFYRRKDLEKIGGYIQDVDNLYKLSKIRLNKIAIPMKAFTNHRAVEGFVDFIKKKNKWGKEYSEEKREFSWMPRTKLERKEFLLNLISIVAIFPSIIESLKLVYNTKKIQGLFVPILKISTFVAYVSGRINF